MFPWYSAAMLAPESNHVGGLRLMKLTGGGGDARQEAHLMFSEKIAAAFEAAETLLRGGDFSTVVDRYREHVTANATRLTR
jgi:acyl-CoA hydrolase